VYLHGRGPYTHAWVEGAGQLAHTHAPLLAIDAGPREESGLWGSDAEAAAR